MSLLTVKEKEKQNERKKKSTKIAINRMSMDKSSIDYIFRLLCWNENFNCIFALSFILIRKTRRCTAERKRNRSARLDCQKYFCKWTFSFSSFTNFNVNDRSHDGFCLQRTKMIWYHFKLHLIQVQRLDLKLYKATHAQTSRNEEKKRNTNKTKTRKTEVKKKNDPALHHGVQTKKNTRARR